MHTFFHGWRRKAGVASLVMALALTSGWIRSLSIEYRAHIQTSQSCHVFISTEGRVEWFRYNEKIFDETVGFTTFDIAHGSTADSWISRDNVNLTWRARWREFDFGSGGFMARHRRIVGDIGRLGFWVAPYWSLVIPLTLLSVYLILWKPRKQV